MIRGIMSEIDVVKGLKLVCERIQVASKKRSQDLAEPRLVAVSKTKPKELIIAAYESGQRHFGENYVQELVDKGHDSEVLERCPDIRWHFIGHLQRNKVNKVAAVPGIHLVETVDTDKLAAALDATWGRIGEQRGPLGVMVQVNTSSEHEKNGVAPAQAAKLTRFVLDKCPNLRLAGFMTIGAFGYDVSLGPNPDFICLKQVRDDVCTEIGLNASDLELSMGMSDDFEHAIEMGSTNIRVGSSIFGHREPKAAV